MLNKHVLFYFKIVSNDAPSTGSKHSCSKPQALITGTDQYTLAYGKVVDTVYKSVVGCGMSRYLVVCPPFITKLGVPEIVLVAPDHLVTAPGSVNTIKQKRKEHLKKYSSNTTKNGKKHE